MSYTARSGTRTTNISVSQYWDPEDVLQLYNDGRCVGYAPSKGRKCRKPVGYIGDLLQGLAEQRPNPELLREDLYLLARYGLCAQFHRGQADGMVEKWTRWMRAAYPAREDIVEAQPISGRRDSVISNNSSQSSSFVSPVTLRRSTTTTTSATPTARELSIERMIEELNEVVRTAQRNIALLEYNPLQAIASPPLSRVSTSDISSLHLSRASTTASASLPRARTRAEAPTPLAIAREVRHAAPVSRTIISAVSTPAPSALVAPSTTQANIPIATSTTSVTSRTPVVSISPVALRSTATTLSTPCTRIHARRLSLDEECPICYNDIPLSQSPRSELVWCRSSCGRSVHKACFERWEAQCEVTGRPLSCSICRSPWASTDCGCSCSVTHSPRRAVEADCAICKDSMVHTSDDTTGPDLVWCKTGCGRSVHKDCFTLWESQCTENGRAATCVMCRATWNDQCVC